MGTPSRLALIPLLCSAILSCNQPFDPRAPYTDHLVVYAVLSNDRDEQFVRLFTTYNPPSFDPYVIKEDQQVTGAFVTIGGFIFSDTLLTRPDTSRYKTRLLVYKADGFRPSPGAFYHLQIVAPGFPTASATIGLPGQGTINYTGSGLLQSPQSYSSSAEIGVFVSLSTRALASVTRLILEYDVSDGVTTSSLSTEVPNTFVSTSAGFDFSRPVYPALRKFEQNPGYLPRYRTSFSRDAYTLTLDNILKGHQGKSITFRRARFMLLQTEENYFKYYSVTNGFRDSLSIRLDQPLYSNINGGVGLFAGYTVDTLSFSYQLPFAYNR